MDALDCRSVFKGEVEPPAAVALFLDAPVIARPARKEEEKRKRGRGEEEKRGRVEERKRGREEERKGEKGEESMVLSIGVRIQCKGVRFQGEQFATTGKLNI